MRGKNRENAQKNEKGENGCFFVKSIQIKNFYWKIDFTQFSFFVKVRVILNRNIDQNTELVSICLTDFLLYATLNASFKMFSSKP